MTKTIPQLYTAHPVGTVADGMKIPVHDGTDLGAALVETARAYYLDNASILALPGLVSLSNSNATNAAAIAGLSTQASMVAVHSLGSQVIGTQTVSVDTYNGDATVVMNLNDSLIYQGSWIFQNLLPVTNKSSTITTVNASSTITQTGGTTFAATDTDRLITGTNIPANTYMTFVSSTSATLKDSAGAAVLATGAGTGIAATISSPDMSINVQWKVAGNNSYVPANFTFAATGPGTGVGPLYAMNWWAEHTQGADASHHVQEGHLKIWNQAAHGNATPASGIYTDASARQLDLTWMNIYTGTDWGTTRQAMEMRLNQTRTTTGGTQIFQRYKSSLYITRA